jgi:hypothetical protein
MNREEYAEENDVRKERNLRRAEPLFITALVSLLIWHT